MKDCFLQKNRGTNKINRGIMGCEFKRRERKLRIDTYGGQVVDDSH